MTVTCQQQHALPTLKTHCCGSFTVTWGGFFVFGLTQSNARSFSMCNLCSEKCWCTEQEIRSISEVHDNTGLGLDQFDSQAPPGGRLATWRRAPWAWRRQGLGRGAWRRLGAAVWRWCPVPGEGGWFPHNGQQFGSSIRCCTFHPPGWFSRTHLEDACERMKNWDHAVKRHLCINHTKLLLNSVDKQTKKPPHLSRSCYWSSQTLEWKKKRSLTNGWTEILAVVQQREWNLQEGAKIVADC